MMTPISNAITDMITDSLMNCLMSCDRMAPMDFLTPTSFMRFIARESGKIDEVENGDDKNEDGCCRKDVNGLCVSLFGDIEKLIRGMEEAELRGGGYDGGRVRVCVVKEVGGFLLFGFGLNQMKDHTLKQPYRRLHLNNPAL